MQHEDQQPPVRAGAAERGSALEQLNASSASASSTISTVARATSSGTAAGSSPAAVLMNNCYQDYGVRNAADLADLLDG